jgi:hypothetical protein
MGRTCGTTVEAGGEGGIVPTTFPYAPTAMQAHAMCHPVRRSWPVAPRVCYIGGSSRRSGLWITAGMPWKYSEGIKKTHGIFGGSAMFQDIFHRANYSMWRKVFCCNGLRSFTLVTEKVVSNASLVKQCRFGSDRLGGADRTRGAGVCCVSHGAVRIATRNSR